MSEEIIVNQSFSWKKKILYHKNLENFSEENERNIAIPTYTLISGHARREQAEAQLR